MTTVCNVCKAIIAPRGAVIVNDPNAEWHQLYPAIADHFAHHHPNHVEVLTRVATSFMGYLLSRMTLSSDPKFLAMQRIEASTIWTAIADEFEQAEEAKAPALVRLN